MPKRCIATGYYYASIIPSNDMFATYSEDDVLWDVFDESDVYGLATDKQGNWVAGYEGLYYSHDDGVTWNASNHTHPQPYCHRTSSIATDGLGNWLAIEGILCVTSDPFHSIYLSTNNGETWSVVATLADVGACYGLAYGNGVWIITTFNELYRSTNMVDWTRILDSSADLYFGQVATDGAGVWCTAVRYGDFWVESVPPGDGDYPGQIWRSDDNGLTWAKAYQSLTIGFNLWSIASDKDLVWCAGSWYDGPMENKVIIRSTDNGASWGIGYAPGTYMENPNIASDEAGNWAITMQSGSGALLLLSDDDGATWNPVTPLYDEVKTDAVAFGGSLCPLPEIFVHDVEYV